MSCRVVVSGLGPAGLLQEGETVLTRPEMLWVTYTAGRYQNKPPALLPRRLSPLLPFSMSTAGASYRAVAAAPLVPSPARVWYRNGVLRTEDDPYGSGRK